MGAYMYVSEQDRITKRKVSDEAVNESFQEALKFDPSLMIEEYSHKRRGFFSSWFKKDNEPTYTIYHETPAFDGSAYQARLQFSGSGNKKIVLAYLHGIINGCANHEERSLNTNNQTNTK